MFSDAFINVQSPVHSCDPRVRVAVAAAMSLVIATSQSVQAQAIALAAALVLAAISRLPLRPTLRRLMPLNAFLLVLWIVLPMTTPGDAALHIRSTALTAEGVAHALGITLRANAIVLLVTTLVASLDIVEFGRALNALRVPAKLVTLLLFTVRYTAVLRDEYAALRRAMRVRCFVARTNTHTLRALGYLAGMLLVRGFERSARVLMAMKCRGYTGVFPMHEPRRLRPRDTLLAAACIACAATMLWTEWR